MEIPLSYDDLLLFTLHLHETGHSLHFQNGNLKQLIVLDPKFFDDAMRCFVTIGQVALKFWKKSEWEIMRSSGRIEKSYILHLWKKNDPAFYRNREYLLGVLMDLDIICLPKVCDKDGFEIHQTLFFVPSMVNGCPPSDLPTLLSISSGKALQMRFEFADILPPAVYNGLVCTSLSLWQVYEGQLYDGCVTLQSGSGHLLVMQRESHAVMISFLHKKGPEHVDVDICRAVRLFFNQTIQRILSTYQMSRDDVIDDLITITCRPHTFAILLKERDEQVRHILYSRNKDSVS